RKKATRKKAATKKATRKKTNRRRRLAVDPVRRDTVLALLANHDPHPTCALDHANPYELLAATILSAQCTDVRVNIVTPALFARYPRPEDLAAAEQEDVEEFVHTTGFFRNKAKNLIGMARNLVERFGSEVPPGMDDLLSLPGVARKTANVVRGECYGLADGVVVDTHVLRISNRLGFTREDSPVKIERDLMKVVPPDDWIVFSHRLIRLGRSLCPARKPRCEECFLAPHCPQTGV
ncbi:MAG: endonuclease-3, partial [Pseudohongiellaceae bacterium]